MHSSSLGETDPELSLGSYGRRTLPTSSFYNDIMADKFSAYPKTTLLHAYPACVDALGTEMPAVIRWAVRGAGVRALKGGLRRVHGVGSDESEHEGGFRLLDEYGSRGEDHSLHGEARTLCLTTS